MNWWGNSLEKAVGFSNIASNALKKAQKKIDMVLDIPVDEDICNRAGYKSDIKTEMDVSNDNLIQICPHAVKLDTEFSDIDFNCPKDQYSKANIVSLPDPPNHVCQRFGDWNSEDSLTASQFEVFTDKYSDKNAVTLIDNVDLIQSVERSPQVIEIDDGNGEDEIEPKLFSNRNSNLSISSYGTTSTIKKCVSDVDLSGHTDDLTCTSNDATFLDDSINEDTTTNDNVMNVSFNRLSFDSTDYEQRTINDGNSEEASKNELQLSQQLAIICPNKDDIESNTTSSDIELLSCGTSNNGDNQPSNPVSSRYFATDYMKHIRSASGSSISIYKIDNGDYASEPDHISNQLLDYQKQLNELSRVLDIRESKITQLSRENINLRDTINNLTRQIEQVNERQETDATDINALTREFTTRLSEAEKRYQIANKERDQLRKQVSELEKVESQQIDRVIKEKEEQLASLLREGEILAQDQLKASNTIKKLRNAVKERESENVATNQKVTKLEFEISHLKKVLDNKEDNERKHVEGITQLTKAVEKMEKENIQFNNTNQVLQERNHSLESALDKLSLDAGNLRKHVLELESEKSAIQKDHQNLIDQHSNKTDTISDIRSKAEHNEKEVCLLQKRLQMQTRESNYKEEEYNSRISYLQERLAEMEQRNEELNEAASVATRPVIRQLEAIQNACSTHTSNWEHIEKNLNNKIIDLHQKLSMAEETTETYKEQLQSRDIQSNSLREEKNRIMNQYNQEYNLRQSLIDEKISIENKYNLFQEDFKKERDSFNKKIKDLENNLASIQQVLETEKQSSSNLSSKLNSLQMLMNQRQSQERRDERSRTISETSTINEIEPEDSISMISNKSMNSPDRRNNNVPLHSLRQQGVAVMIEHLEASLKQKEGQVNKLQIEMGNLRRSRENVIDEMTQLTQTVEHLQSTVKVQQTEITSMSDLNDRYNALLQMYGEKMEECEELRMDISEVKEVYRSHIDTLSKSVK